MNDAVYIGKVHEIFRIAERYADEVRMENRKKIKTRKPRIYNMPTIESNPNIQGPLYVTQEFKDAYKLKKMEEKKQETRNYEKELFTCLARKERLEYKLSKLNTTKKKDSKKSINIKFQIRDLDDKIEMLQQESGINLNKEKGNSKLGKIWNRIKLTFSKTCKKVKKFFKKHSDTIDKLLYTTSETILVIMPFICIGLFKVITGL